MGLLRYGEVCDLFYFKTFFPNYNLDLRYYGQLFYLFYDKVDVEFNFLVLESV